MLAASSLTSCSLKPVVFIYTAHEDNRIQQFNKELKAKFPEYEIKIVYKTSSALMNELGALGSRSDCNIFLGIEITNAEILLNQNSNIFADLSDFDTSMYLDELLEYQKDVVLADGSIRKGHKKYHIQDKEAGCIVYSKSKCGDNVPTSYEDLLDPRFNKSIIMPNPKSSGTGYYFLNGLASLYGKEKALEYFGKLDSNIQEWSSSGSGPVKGVDQKRISVGLGMHFQAVEYANKNPDIGITYFPEGSPYSLFTMGMMNGSQNNKAVKDVYTYLYEYVNYLDNANIVPESLYKDEYAYTPTVPNWKSPSDYGVDYMNMKNLLDPGYKNSLLDDWKL